MDSNNYRRPCNINRIIDAKYSIDPLKIIIYASKASSLFDFQVIIKLKC
jgi:hypothetical protein